MTILISILGIVVRVAGAVLTMALGWASSLLFGRVPRSRQVFVVLMAAGSLLWLVLLIAAGLPAISAFVLDITPHPASLSRAAVQVAILVGVALLPLGVGLAAYLAPTGGDRVTGPAMLVELLRGYLITPVLAGLMLFLPAVGISRKIRSVRHGWSDVHIAIVAKPDGYDDIVSDLQRALASAGVPVVANDAPVVLSLPALLLTKVAGPNVRKLRPDRLVELSGPNLRIGVYPSDIAISGPSLDRGRARAAIISRLATAAAHLTTSAEGQEVEDRLDDLARRWTSGRAADPATVAEAFEPIDRMLIGVQISPDEWDTLYRVRLQIERDVLAGNVPGTSLPTDAVADHRPGMAPASRSERMPARTSSGRPPESSHGALP